MSKAQKIFRKQEKRIVKLLYKKGLITDFSISEFYWCEHRSLRHWKSHKPLYVPEVYFGSGPDYWGEYDEHELVYTIINRLYFENLKKDTDATGAPQESSFKYKGRRWFINYLKKLPTKVSDNKINRVVKRIHIDY